MIFGLLGVLQVRVILRQLKDLEIEEHLLTIGKKYRFNKLQQSTFIFTCHAVIVFQLGID